jgi:hypothetical protein
VLCSLQDHLGTKTRDLDHPILVGAENTNILLPYGFNTLEYSWVKTTIAIYMLEEYSVANECQQAFWHRCRGSRLILSIH